LLFQKTQMTKEINLKEKWDFVITQLSQQFADGDDLNIDGVIYLIGVQELGQGHRKPYAYCYL
jgi:hypothetical protein